MSRPVLLIDYGEVICRPQPARLVAEMTRLCGLDPATFGERYWEHRLDYDRGLAPAEYWSRVRGSEPSARELAELRRLDTDSWMELEPRTLSVLDEQRRAGKRLALLSNAPRDLADRLSGEAALAHFDPLLFSSGLGLVKPEPEIFAAALEHLGCSAREVVFIDDREVNVDAAASAGMAAIRFSSPEALGEALLTLS